MSEEAKKQAEKTKGAVKGEKPKDGAAPAQAAPGTAADVATANAATESTPKKKKRAKKKALTDGQVHVFASYNNTIVTVTDSKGDSVCWSSSGASGFTGTRKSTPYAAQIAAENTMNKAKLLGLERAHIFVKGTGIGRDQALRAIAASAIDIQSITDLTSLPHGGVRPKKARRV